MTSMPGATRALRRGAVAALAAGALAAAGCRQDMHDAPRYEPLEASDFWADGQSARPPIPGTVAQGQLHDDIVLATGRDAGGLPATSFPIPVDRQTLARGQERYNIYCAPCHDQAGTGQGMIVRRGYRVPPSFHIDRLRESPPGYFVDVMTRGFATMPSYSAQVTAPDRWAIAAYIRALQLSQNFPAADLSQAERARLPEAPR